MKLHAPVPWSSSPNGKPVAELVPHRPRRQSARGVRKNELFIAGDIISPIDVEADALK